MNISSFPGKYFNYNLFLNTYFVVFEILFIIFFSMVVSLYLQCSVDGLIGNDGYFHFRYSSFFWVIDNNFDALPLTIYKSGFPDHHYFFHGLNSFLIYFDESIVNAKLIVSVNIAVMILAFYLLLYVLNIDNKVLWITVLMSGSSVFLYRILMLRVQSLSLAFLFIYLSVLLSGKIRYKNFFLLTSSYIYGLLYSGSVLLCLFVFVFYFIKYFDEDCNDLNKIYHTLLGFILSFCINPNFLSNLMFIYQYITIGFIYDLSRDNIKWLPYDTGYYLQTNTIGFILLIAAFFLTIYSVRKYSCISKTMMIYTVIQLIISFKFRRHIEYYAPFSVLTFLCIYKETFRNYVSSNTLEYFLEYIYNNKLMIYLMIFILFTMNFFTARNMIVYFDKPNYADSCKWLKASTQEDEMIINLFWWDYSQLYYYLNNRRFLWGLEPGFLYIEERRLAIELLELLRGERDQYPISLNEIKYPWRYMFVGKQKGFDPSLFLLLGNSNLKKMYEDDHSAIFKRPF